MKKTKGNLFTFFILIIALAFIYSIGYGFTADQPPTGSKQSSAPLPEYRVGTTFVYTDGAWETVTATAPGKVTWTNDLGAVYSGSPDFTYRPAKWEHRTGQGDRRYMVQTGLIFKKRTSIWPLQKENSVIFTETSTWQRNEASPRSYQTEWSCSVEGTERVSVMAGEFDAWKIECVRSTMPSSSGMSRVRETRTWYYSPEVEHYVLMTRHYPQNKRPTKRKELLAVLPPADGIPADARRKMSKSFQQALEFKKSGEPVSWSAPKAAVSGEIIPKGTFKLTDGSYSRRYVERLTLPDGQRAYYGMAFRDSKGVWGIPRR